MKKLLFTLFTLSMLASCSEVSYGQGDVVTFSTFDQVTIKPFNVITPFTLNYGFEQSLDSTGRLSVFEGVGIGHAFGDSSKLVINSVIFFGGVAYKLFKDYAIKFGAGIGYNASTDKGFFGINTRFEVSKVTGLFAKAFGAKPKRKSRFSIGIL